MLRELLVSFGIEFDPQGNLDKGDKAVDGMLGKLKSFGIAAAAAFTVDALVGFTKEILFQADALAKQSQALGVSAADLQGWQHAASLSGSSAEEFSSAFTKFTRNVAEASDAAQGPAAKAFQALGVSIKDASGNLGQPIELLDGVVAGLEGIQDPARRTQIVMDLFGRSGAKLLPLFNEGAEGIRKLRDEVHELGFAFDDAFLASAQEVNDNVDRLKLGLRGLFIQVIGPLLPGLVSITQTLVAGAKGFVAWIKGGRVLQSVLGVLAGNAIVKMVRLLPALIARFGGFNKIMLRLGAVIARFILPFLALEDAIVFLTGGKSAIGKGLDALFGAGTGKKVQQSIAQTAGKIFEMAKDAVAFFKLWVTEPEKVRDSLGGLGVFLGEWGKETIGLGKFVTDALTNGWDNFKVKATAAGDGILLALRIVWTEIKFGFLAAAAEISDAFDNAWSSILSGANAALQAMADVLANLPGTEDVTAALRGAGVGLVEGAPKGGAGEFVANEKQRERLLIADEFDRIGAVATAPAGGRGGTVTVDAPTTNHISVTVPAGTERSMAERTGKAVGNAIKGPSLRAAQEALVPVVP